MGVNIPATAQNILTRLGENLSGELKSVGNTLISGLTTQVSAAVENKMANNHTNNIDAFKARLGTGFRPNLFHVEFNFTTKTMNSSTDKKTGAVTKTATAVSMDDSDFFNTVIDGIILNPSYTKGEPSGKSSFTIADIKKYVTSLKNKKADKVYTFPLLCTGANLPSAGLEMTGEVVKNKKYAKGNNPGVLTCDITQDQWNINYNFCKNYINNVSDGKAVYWYPNEYKFNVNVSLYSTAFEEYQTFTFKNCTIIDVPQLPLSMAQVTSIPTFSITIDYADYMVSYFAPKFTNFGFAGQIYSKEVQNLISLNTQYGILGAASRVPSYPNIVASNEMIREKGLVTKAQSAISESNTVVNEEFFRENDLMEASKIIESIPNSAATAELQRETDLMKKSQIIKPTLNIENDTILTKDKSLVAESKVKT